MAEFSCMTCFQWLLALLEIPCCILMVIGIGTSSWIHYIDNTGGSTIVHEYGLWEVCTKDGASTTGCVATDEVHTAALVDLVDLLAIRVVLIISACFCVLGVICVYMMVNKCCEACSAICFTVCMFIATALAWIGVGYFLGGVMASPSKEKITFEWSLIITCTASVVITLLFVLSICYAFLLYRSRTAKSEMRTEEWIEASEQEKDNADDNWSQVNYGVAAEVGVDEVDVRQHEVDEAKRWDIAADDHRGVVLRTFMSAEN